MMRVKARFVFMVCGALILVVGLLFAMGILSMPRDFSSPQTVIRLVDGKGAPLAGIRVVRNWYDSDSGKEGNDQVVSDPAGIARFSKVPANVGPFTGAWERPTPVWGCVVPEAARPPPFMSATSGFVPLHPKAKRCEKWDSPIKIRMASGLVHPLTASRTPWRISHFPGP